ncbi:coagulation factor II (thrombin) receptor-like 1, tandem duplicate 2 [Chiloscyllium plagiosum]|uniref:coagulation factor II (thrombin) receptor-like 1, tandem duplicate 2 n=1 Tax=Chiloscyllium plagiosum TaxID=36176 RepID=UPI001CB7BF4E|nr:coagulation factor II (thrombin) receptor-like 1, tandem duplicate 2 [Chiloscyllium plagiosum]
MEKMTGVVLAVWLLALPICCDSKPGASERGCKSASQRSFIGIQTNDSNCGSGFKVNEFAESVLTSGLTTVFLPLVYIIVFIIGLPVNAMALWVFIYRTKMKHPAAIYMANLALADLLFIIWFPLKISYHLNGNNWTYGEGLCKVLVVFFYGNMYCSILFMTCLSVQRYWVVVNPISQTRRKTHIAYGVSIFIWIMIILGTMPLYLNIQQTVKIVNLDITTCHDVLPEEQLASSMFDYFLSLAIGVYFFPALLTVTAYVLMIKTLKASSNEDSIGKSRKRAIELIITVLIMYLVCFTPSNIILVVHYSLLKHGNDNVYAFYIVSLCLSTINSCIDPFVYYFVSKDFRDHVKNTLRCRSVRTVRSIQASFASKKQSKRSGSYTSASKITTTSTTNC